MTEEELYQISQIIDEKLKARLDEQSTTLTNELKSGDLSKKMDGLRDEFARMSSQFDTMRIRQDAMALHMDPRVASRRGDEHILGRSLPNTSAPRRSEGVRMPNFVL